MIPEKKKEIISLIPIGLILIVTPLICHYQIYKTNLENCDWHAVDRSYEVDLFLLSKSVVICLVAVLMLAIFVFLKQYKQGLKVETYPLIMYVLLVGFHLHSSALK